MSAQDRQPADFVVRGTAVYTLDPARPWAEQALDLHTALRAHTVNAAQAMGLAQQTGQLSPGMSADFIVLDRNLFDTPIEQVHDTQVRQTWFADRLVHDGSPPGRAAFA